MTTFPAIACRNIEIPEPYTLALTRADPPPSSRRSTNVRSPFPIGDNEIKTIAVRLSCIPLLLLFPLSSRSQTGQSATAEDVVRDIYRLVSFSPDRPPNWEKVRAHFVPSANVFLRVSRDSSHVFSVEGFIDDFIKFAEQPRVKENGFSEAVVKAVTTEIGTIAHVLVLYEAQITGSQRPPQLGVDSWQLIKQRDQWKILSVTNEIPSKERPFPKTLQN